MLGNAPWSDMGRIESDIQDIKGQLYKFAEAHQITTLSSRLDSLEHTVQGISSSLDGLQSRMQEMEEALK